MNKHSIGFNAGVVWRILSDNVRRTRDELKRESGLSDGDLNAAVGWLACEDKIEFEALPGKNEVAFIVHFNNYF